MIGFLIMLAVQVSVADDFNQEQLEVREMLASGKILSLDKILSALQKELPGYHLLKVKLESKYDLPVYELDFVNPGGEVLEIEVDASSGTIIKQKIETD